MFAAIGDRIGQEQRGAWETIAAVNAYFSLLEHEMVLLFAFTDLDPTDGALQTLIGDRWGLKFKCLFDISDRSTKCVYEALRKVAETYRNPYSHGGFEKGSAVLWFHVPGVAAMPARLSDYRDSPHFELFPVQPESFDKKTARRSTRPRGGCGKGPTRTHSIGSTRDWTSSSMPNRERATAI